LTDNVHKVSNSIKEGNGTNFVLFHLSSIPLLCLYFPVKPYVKKLCAVENVNALQYGIFLNRVDTVLISAAPAVLDINIITLQHNTDTTEVQSVSCDEINLTFCENLQTATKEEEDPLLVAFPLPNTESEVS
jgi:hypothetical protein